MYVVLKQCWRSLQFYEMENISWTKASGKWSHKNSDILQLKQLSERLPGWEGRGVVELRPSSIDLLPVWIHFCGEITLHRLPSKYDLSLSILGARKNYRSTVIGIYWRGETFMSRLGEALQGLISLSDVACNDSLDFTTN